MSEYTPPTEQVREGYASDPESVGWAAELRAEFDRWLAAHDAEVRAQALVVTDEMLLRAVDAYMRSSGESEDGSSLVHKNMHAALEAAFRENGSSDS